MPLEAGTRLGDYEIVSSLGVGGMGEVYRARDTNLGREVAIKVLPTDVAADSERLQRFELEARALASLNHPNIATLHGFERAEGKPFLIMELVEGETLDERIKRGPLPLGEALPLFLQIAEGLEAAHRNGVVHRDLKPANVKITGGSTAVSSPSRSGHLKILDFGLAKAMAPAPLSGKDPGMSASPTLTLAATQRGEILGTAAYMSPEQAQGLEIDARADVWAFGICLWEALTGKRPFEADNASMTIARVLQGEPDWSRVDDVPWRLRELLRKCLRKDPGRRLHHIADVRLEIEEAMTEPDRPEPADAPGAASSQSPLRWLALCGLAAAAAGILGWMLRPDPAPSQVPITRTVLSAPPSTPPALSPFASDVAVAPDGSSVVYVSQGSLYVRPIDQLHGSSLDGTRGATQPFVSPDGRWIGYLVGSEIKKIPFNGGPSLTITRGAPTVALGFDWGDDDTIVYGSFGGGGIMRVAAAGGKPEIVVAAETTTADQLTFPTLLPGSTKLLYTIVGLPGRTDQSSIAALDLETGEIRVLVASGYGARYVPPGYLLYGSQAALHAVAFDAERLEVLSDPVPVVENVVTKPSSYAVFAMAGDGSLVYLHTPTAGAESANELVWVDRGGVVEPIDTPPMAFQYPRVSPDGRRISTGRFALETDIWIWDTERRSLTRQTFGPALEFYNIWSPDGESLFFDSNRTGIAQIWRRSADGGGTPSQLTDGPDALLPSSISADGREILVRIGFTSGFDVGVVSVDDGSVERLLATDFDELNPDLSPNGRWLAYQSNESGRIEVYVASYPDVAGGGRWQVSNDGGASPAWSRDGSELFYLAGDPGALRMMAVQVANGPAFSASPARVLFEGPYLAATVGRNWDVAPDGRFLLIRGADGSADNGAGSLVRVQGFRRELERLVSRR